MSIYSIYTITNKIKNIVVYVGYTNDIQQRKSQHKNSSLSSEKPLYRSIRKHGFENFEFDVIYQSKDRTYTLNTMENYFIHEYNTYKNLPDSKGFNLTLGGGGHEGMSTFLDEDGNKHFVSTDDSRVLDGTFRGISTGKTSVKDKDGNTFSVSVNDERYINGELVHVLKGKIHVKDINNKVVTMDKDDPRILSGEFFNLMTGKLSAKDSFGNTMSVKVDDPRIISGELVCVTKGCVTAKDITGKTFKVNKDDPRFATGEIFGHRAKFYKAISPSGEIFYLVGMQKFCSTRDLGSSSMCSVAKGRQSHHKWWKCEEVESFPPNVKIWS